MEKFTASNGLVLVPHEDGSVHWEAGWSPIFVSNALREYFRAERDKELGRWRWPENPDYVVYPTVIDPARREARGVTVASEVIPRTYTVWEDNIDILYGTSSNEDARKQARNAARAYFAAHPVPKPWHSATRGEAWLVDVGDADPRPMIVGNFVVGGAAFYDAKYSVTFALNATAIEDARRLWPEVVSDV